LRRPGDQFGGGRHVDRRRRGGMALLTLIAACGLAALACASARGQQSQVQRGATSFAGLCSRCHSKDLGGGMGPALKGERFTSEWAGRPARALYSRILLTMPFDDPGSLQPGQVMDLTAFLISANSFQPVAAAFTSPDQMGKITLRARE